MTPDVVVVLPAPPHPAARNTAARYYSALLVGLAEHGVAPRVLCVDDGSAARAAEWIEQLPLAFRSFASDPPVQTTARRLRRVRRPFEDAAPRALRSELERELARGYDVLHAEETQLGWLTAARPKAVLSILQINARDWHAAAEAEGPASLATTLRRRVALRAEREIIRRQGRIRVISDALADDARAAGAAAPIDVIPLCLDLSQYAFAPTGRPNVVGLIGSMLWPPTRAAALRLVHEIWPRVLASRGDLRLLVAGWRADTLVADGPLPPGVDIASDLGDHREFFDRIGVLAFPLRAGSGMKIKVLESMALGVAVVTTPTGVEGLRAPEAPAWWEATTDDDIAQAIVSAVDDAAERETRACRARALLEAQCAPRVVSARLLEMFGRMSAAAA